MPTDVEWTMLLGLIETEAVTQILAEPFERSDTTPPGSGRSQRKQGLAPEVARFAQGGFFPSPERGRDLCCSLWG